MTWICLISFGCGGPSDSSELLHSESGQPVTPAPDEDDIAEAEFNFNPPTLSLGNNNSSCAINQSGLLLCWGDNYDSDDNVGGLLGLDDSSDTFEVLPQTVDRSETYIGISIGEFVNCAITGDKQIKCWGKNWAIGNSTIPAANIAAPTHIENRQSFGDIAVGSYHACAINLFGTLYCWGDDWGGKLGRLGDRSAVLESDRGTRYSSIALGRNHTCGITANKKIRCFGFNDNGQLGFGLSDSASYTPTTIDIGTSYKAVSAQGNSTCGITTTKKLKCWGKNNFGQIGIESAGAPVTRPTLLDESSDYEMVEVGGTHTCAITTAGALKCWGKNIFGQVGLGTSSTKVTSPTIVDSANTYLSVSAGLNHTCALRNNGDLYCWGNNGSGGLGDNSVNNRLSPTFVSGGY